MLRKAVRKYVKTIILTAVVGVILYNNQSVSAQTPKRIRFTPCGNILTFSGNLSAKKQRVLYIIRMMKGQILQVKLFAKPNYKEVRLNVYHEANRYNSKFPIVQGEIGTDYDVPIEETGEYSIMVFTNKKTTKFSLWVDVADKGLTC